MFKKSQLTAINAKDKLYIPNGRHKEVEDLPDPGDGKDVLRERAAEVKFAVISLCISFIIVISKLLIINRARIYKAYAFSLGTYINGQHVAAESTAKFSELLLATNSVVLEILYENKWLLIPLAAGVMVSVASWYIVYIDSCIPGVKPPTPFSPNRSRFRTTPRFHTGYIIAMLNGVLVFFLTFFS